MTTYVVFLRGINVGGKTVRKDDLLSVFEHLRFTEIKTLLASGNVVFNSNETNTKVLLNEIEQALTKAFGFEIHVVIRTVDYIEELVIADPFKTITPDPKTRFFVTFLSEGSKKIINIPYETAQKDFKIISATEDDLFSVVLGDGKTTDAMTFLDKNFGKKVTTRNWNTVKKISMLK